MFFFQTTIDVLLGKWRRMLRKRGRRASENEENLQNTRHTATCIDWAAELAPCCTKTKWRHIIPHLPPVTLVKNTGTRRKIARVRHESSFISCYQRRRRTCRCRPYTCKACRRVCVSPRCERRNDAGLLSLQNRFTWPASDKSSPGTVGYPLFTPFTPPPPFLVLFHIYLTFVKTASWSETARGGIIIVFIFEIPGFEIPALEFYVSPYVYSNFNFYVRITHALLITKSAI